MSFRVKPCESIFNTQKHFRNKPMCSHPLPLSLANLSSFEGFLSLSFFLYQLRIWLPSCSLTTAPSHLFTGLLIFSLQAFASPAHSFISSAVADSSCLSLAEPLFLIVPFMPRVSNIPWLEDLPSLFCCFLAARELITALFQEWLLMTEVSTE